MRKKELMGSSLCPAPEKKSDKVIGVSQILEIGGKEILNIDLYFEGELKGRYFADVEEKKRVFYFDGKRYDITLNNCVNLCIDKIFPRDYYYYYSTKDEFTFASKGDEKKAFEYLGVVGMHQWDYEVRNEKNKKARERKRERIDRMMSRVPCVPDNVEVWLKEQIFPENYIFVKKEGEKNSYGCTACGKTGRRKTNWKHGEEVKCPRCGQIVKVNRRKVMKKKKTPVIVLQAYDGQWIERQFKAECCWSAGKKIVELWEEIRVIMAKGATEGKVWSGTLQKADEFEQKFWDKNPAGKKFLESYLYPGNLQEVLEYGDLQNSGLDLIAAAGEKIRVDFFIDKYRNWPWLEYLTKAGLTRLTADLLKYCGQWNIDNVIDRTQKKLCNALRLNGNRTNRLKQINGGYCALLWLQWEQRSGQRISSESLEYLSAKRIGRTEECESVLAVVGSANRLVNYLKKQKGGSKVLTTWRDYLDMAKEEGMDLSDDIVRMPKNLKERHDHLVEIRGARTDEERVQTECYRILDQKIQNNLQRAKRYYWQNEKYTIIPAAKCIELMREGRTLHHCVGSSDTYMVKMAEYKSWILFLRKNEDIKTAYYTIEINTKDDMILQYYSKFNRQPDKKEITQLLEKFKAVLKKRKMQAENAVSQPEAKNILMPAN